MHAPLKTAARPVHTETSENIVICETVFRNIFLSAIKVLQEQLYKHRPRKTLTQQSPQDQLYRSGSKIAGDTATSPLQSHKSDLGRHRYSNSHRTSCRDPDVERHWNSNSHETSCIDPDLGRHRHSNLHKTSCIKPDLEKHRTAIFLQDRLYRSRSRKTLSE